MLTTSGCKAIGIRKLVFVAKTQFLPLLPSHVTKQLTENVLT